MSISPLPPQFPNALSWDAADFGLSIVIPVHNEEKVLPELFKELTRVLAGRLKTCGWTEVLLVNDGSQDRSWELIVAQCDRDPRFVGVNPELLT